MQIIVLKILEHRNAECIGIYFKVDTRLNGIVKKYQVLNGAGHIPAGICR